MKMYRLNDSYEAEPCDLNEWANSIEKDKISTSIKSYADYKNGELELSTVFLGLDHNHSGIGEPILFETMLFHSEIGSLDDLGLMRYSTYEEAKQGHEIVWLRIQEKIKSKTLKLE